MRLIDADDFIEEYKRYGTNSFDFVREIVRKMPTIPSEPKRGRWETEVRTDRLGFKHCYYACSICGRMSEEETPYCALCGAKMDEVE